MDIFRQQDGVVQVRGDLHISEVEEFRQALTGALSLTSELELDFSAVERCDAASFQLLCSLQKSAEKAGKSLHLSSPSLAIQELCATLGLPLEDLTNNSEN